MAALPLPSPGRASLAGCRCTSGLAYPACCGPLHAGAAAATASALMRSRFSAFALGLRDHLLVTWHPETRPALLELDESIEWRRLQIVDTTAGGAADETGIVEFRASFREGGRAGLLHERSSFARLGGRWVYVDGTILGT